MKSKKGVYILAEGGSYERELFPTKKKIIVEESIDSYLNSSSKRLYDNRLKN